MQVEAERKKRAAILESEGIKEAEVLTDICYLLIFIFRVFILQFNTGK